jgi:hypothetical protein
VSTLVGILVIASTALAVALGLATRGRAARSAALRRCPLCAQDAVRAFECHGIGGTLVQLRLECGQCGIRRRIVTSENDMLRLARRLQHDRRLIGASAIWMTRARTRGEFAAFARALRDDVVGAEDFLALTQRRRPALPGNGRGAAG